MSKFLTFIGMPVVGSERNAKIEIEESKVSINYNGKEKVFNVAHVERIVREEGIHNLRYTYVFAPGEVVKGVVTDDNLLKILLNSDSEEEITFTFRRDGLYDGFSCKVQRDFFYEIKKDLDEITAGHNRTYYTNDKYSIERVL